MANAPNSGDSLIINGSNEPQYACMWPVGSLFLSAVSTNPAIMLGFGVWTAVGTGRALVGIDGSQVEFDTMGKVGGAKSHTLTTAELPAHTHVGQAQGGTTAASTGTHAMTSTATGGSVRSVEATTSTGSGQAFSTLTPYLVVAIWQRVT